MDHFAQELLIESWILYVIGIFCIGCRLTSRRIAKQSWRKLEVDDYLMCVVVITFTGVMVCVNQVSINGSNYMSPEIAATLTPESRRSAVWGSKMTFALEHFTLSSLWLVKGCLLLVYNRLTLGLREHIVVRVVAVYVAVSFVVIEILFCAVWCGPPITMYWDVPAKEEQCSSYYNHLITSTVFNISSDLMMLCIPLPLLVRSRLPWKRKILLCLVFSLGVFVVLMAILNRYYNFSEQHTLTFLKWYVAEVSTAVYVGNLPLLWPLLKRVFHLHTFAQSRPTKTISRPSAYPASRSRGLTSRGMPASSTESILHETDPPGIDKVGVSGLDHGVELTPIPERAYRAMITAERGQSSIKDEGTAREGNDSGEMGIVRTVEVLQYRE
ncbi:hypothetical protein BDW42DRAFT_191123 [Aspergillus taichungensis]|uniref:Rhodopsin domain-containing protein n=1 Tax=Aspergillus taichungensis TaxID=482145 RepID=A0A2J5I520_9EURO|nr:hypothetical protein BDW42DRAFT_191123 [Aspergillus taichungensis]